MRSRGLSIACLLLGLVGVASAQGISSDEYDLIEATPGGPVLAIRRPTLSERERWEIEQLKSETPDETRRRLRDDNQYAYPLWGWMGRAPSCFAKVFLTRRPMKFVEDVGALPRAERAELLIREMRSLSSDYLAAARVVVASYADNTRPKNAVSFGGLRHAACAVLYAAACHDDAELVRSLFSEWEATRPPLEEIVAAAEGTIPRSCSWVLNGYSTFSSGDVYNLLMLCHRKHGGFDEVAALSLPEEIDVSEDKNVIPWDRDWPAKDRVPREGDRDAIGLVRVDFYWLCRGAHSTSGYQQLKSFDKQLDEVADFVTVTSPQP